ncbi:MAG: DUF1549 domain-containing protein, partial [Pirellula sp.]
MQASSHRRSFFVYPLCLLLMGLSMGSLWAQDESAGSKNARRPTIPPQTEKIDKAIEAGWSDAGIRPSPLEEELKWCRRVYLDVIGRIPSFDEMSVFMKDKSPDRKLNLVRRLLEDDQYTEEYANHWSTIWANIL